MMRTSVEELVLAVGLALLALAATGCERAPRDGRGRAAAPKRTLSREPPCQDVPKLTILEQLERGGKLENPPIVVLDGPMTTYTLTIGGVEIGSEVERTWTYRLLELELEPEPEPEPCSRFPWARP